MVSNVDLSVVVHFRFYNFVKCIEHRAAVLERSQHVDTNCTSDCSPVRYHVRDLPKKIRYIKCYLIIILFIQILSIPTDTDNYLMAREYAENKTAHSRKAAPICILTDHVTHLILTT